MLRGSATTKLLPGDGAVLSIRPERINVRLTASGDGDGLAGTIRRTVFLGHLVRCVVELTTDVVITAEGTRDAAAGWADGERVLVDWAPRDALAMPDADSS